MLRRLPGGTARDSLLDEILSFFGGRPQWMVAQLIESGKLTLDDIRELERAATEAVQVTVIDTLNRIPAEN